MLSRIITAGFLSSVACMILFYLLSDLLGNQMILKEEYLLSADIWRNPNLLSRNLNTFLKYFGAFILTNTLWSYVYYKRQHTVGGNPIQKGIKFFFLFWLLTIPLHFWFWVMIYFPMSILIYNVFVTHLIMFTVAGMIIGKVCSN